MVRLASRYFQDVASFAGMTPNSFFDYVKKIPYNRDPHQTEFLQRPYYTIAGNRPGGDCDDKAIVSGAYAVCNNIPFRFKAMGRYNDKPLHHVATDLFLNGNWVHFDPTYVDQVFGKYLFTPQRQMIIGAWNG
jgi:transglutaminase-like putative cysteine protease